MRVVKEQNSLEEDDRRRNSNEDNADMCIKRREIFDFSKAVFNQ